MKAHVEPDAPKTRRFLQYIYGELLDRAPLREREAIQIRVAEDLTPFPKITLLPDEDADGKYIQKELEVKLLRNLEKYMALYEYMRKTFWEVGASLFPEMEDGKKLDMLISLVIVRPTAVYREAAKLGLKIPAVVSAEAQDMTAPPIFTENPSEIHWCGAVVSIPPDSNQLCFCRVAFDKKVGEVFSWDEVAEAIDPLAHEHNDIKWRSVYDVARKINKKVAEATGKPLFKTACLSYSRLA